VLCQAVIQQRTDLRRSSVTNEVQDNCSLVAVGVNSPGCRGLGVRSIDLALGRCTEDVSSRGLAGSDLCALCKVDAVGCFDKSGDTERRL
jgi:hypothetical protein